jgi:acyl-CoA synthetase (NDP forming)
VERAWYFLEFQRARESGDCCAGGPKQCKGGSLLCGGLGRAGVGSWWRLFQAYQLRFDTTEGEFQMEREELDYIFKPRSIAIIGATSNPRKFGFRFVHYIKEHRYEGKIYPVNPKGGEVLGLKIYPSLDSIDDKVDLAVVLTAGETVPQAIKECGIKGVKGVVVISAGFGELGGEGKRLEEEALRIARSMGIRLVGPNCLGIVNLEIGLNATTCAVVPKDKGSLGFISQSGSSLELLFSLSGERGIYFNKVVSSGNEADLNLVDYLEYFSHDPSINVILMYIEGIGEKNGRRFLELARNTTPQKPVVALKVGRTAVAEMAISTHTGALVGNAGLYSAVFKQSGIIEAKTFEELFDYGLAFSGGRIPTGDRVAIMGPGGPGISAADVSAEEGILIPEFSKQTKEHFKRIVPAFMAGLRNPLDITPSLPMDEREQIYLTLLEDENTDGAIILTSALFYMKKFSEIIPRVYAKSSKPVFVGSIMSMTLPEIQETARVLGKAGIPFYPSPERAAKAYSVIVKYGRYLKMLKERERWRVE